MQEQALLKVVGEVSVEAAMAALPKHLARAREEKDIMEIEVTSIIIQRNIMDPEGTRNATLR